MISATLDVEEIQDEELVRRIRAGGNKNQDLPIRRNIGLMINEVGVDFRTQFFWLGVLPVY